MEGPEITFLFQFGNLRDTVTCACSAITLKSLKDMACEFINSKVRKIVSYSCYKCGYWFLSIVALKKKAALNLHRDTLSE